MLTDHEKDYLHQGFSIFKYLWVAMLASLGVYIVVCEFIAKSGAEDVPVNPDFSIEAFSKGFFCSSFFLLVISIFLRKAMLSAKFFSPSPNSSNQTLNRALRRYLFAMMISLAISECVGVFGIVLFLNTGVLLLLYPFIIVSAAAMIYHRPKYKELEDLIRGRVGNWFQDIYRDFN